MASRRYQYCTQLNAQTSSDGFISRYTYMIAYALKKFETPISYDYTSYAILDSLHMFCANPLPKSADYCHFDSMEWTFVNFESERN